MSTAISKSLPHGGDTAGGEDRRGRGRGHGSAHRFLESVGCGLVTSCIAEGNETLAKDHPETHLAEAHELYVEALAATWRRGTTTSRSTANELSR